MKVSLDKNPCLFLQSQNSSNLPVHKDPYPDNVASCWLASPSRNWRKGDEKFKKKYKTYAQQFVNVGISTF